MSEQEKTSPAEPDEKQMNLAVHYSKSSLFRVIHADGVYGGATPTAGNVMMTIFSHRIPFPERTMIDAFGNEITRGRVAKSGVERELEVSIVMSLELAKSVLQWLDNSIKNVETLQQPLKK